MILPRPLSAQESGGRVHREDDVLSLALIGVNSMVSAWSSSNPALISIFYLLLVNIAWPTFKKYDLIGLALQKPRPFSGSVEAKANLFSLQPKADIAFAE